MLSDLFVITSVIKNMYHVQQQLEIVEQAKIIIK